MESVFDRLIDAIDELGKANLECQEVCPTEGSCSNCTKAVTDGKNILCGPAIRRERARMEIERLKTEYEERLSRPIASLEFYGLQTNIVNMLCNRVGLFLRDLFPLERLREVECLGRIRMSEICVALKNCLDDEIMEHDYGDG